MKKIPVLIKTVALIVAAGLFIADGGAQEKGQSATYEALAQLYAGAEKEGTVIIWGPTDAIISKNASRPG